MENKLITFAIHTSGKAQILKRVLEENGINVYLEEVDKLSSLAGNSAGLYVRIKESDVSKALSLVEENDLFNYSDAQTYRVDDGRKRVLVAVDFSTYSLQACKIAFGIARKANAKVKILHVYYNVQFPSSLPFADSLKDEDDDIGLLDKVRKQMLDLCNEIDKKITNKEFPSVNYSYSIREGIVEDEIEEFIEEYKPALLVIGTKGKGESPYRLGNVAADIIDMTNVPVLAVPETSPFVVGEVKHLAFITNFRDRDIMSFNTLVELLSPYSDFKITLVHINLANKKGDKWSEQELAGMKEYFYKLHPTLNVEYKLIDTPDMVTAIQDFIIKEDVAIVVLNSRRQNILRRMFVPSISRKMLMKSNVALLVLRG